MASDYCITQFHFLNWNLIIYECLYYKLLVIFVSIAIY